MIIMHDMNLTGPELPAVSALSRALKPQAIALLIEHGCTFTTVGDDLIRITYPQGTTRTELYPQTQCTRYRVQLPDGLELREEEIPGKRTVALKADLKGGKGASHNEQTEEKNTQW